MRIGIYADLRNPPRWQRDWARVYAFALELCERADRGGLHSLWFTEHHLFEDGYLPQPLTFAAAAAARTERVRIGTSILIAGLRPAADIAEQAAVVDIVSNGRLELGLGAGYRPPEFDLYGVDGARPHALLYRRVEELRSLWAEGRVTPPPVQERIPIWLGVTGPRGAYRAGELGAGLLRIDRALVAAYERGLADPAARRIAGPANIVLSDDPERDWPALREHVAYQWGSYARYRVEGTDRPEPAPIDPDAWRARGPFDGFAVLTPAEAAAAIRARADGLDAETVYLWATVPGAAEHLAERNVELAVTELAPLLSE
jgi:alkanesulfonate monooxygenase SsuD/methylene tetrahydromethanopterin reductase-like flavin-dependent oxidoreductase (luciferase family)